MPPIPPMLLADAVVNWSLAATIFLAVIAGAGQITLWITLKAPQKRTVAFEGVPVDKKEFDRHVEENRDDHDKMFSKISGVERGLEQRCAARMEKSDATSLESRRALHRDVAEIDRKVAGLAKEAELSNQRIILMDQKIDRLIERQNQ